MPSQHGIHDWLLEHATSKIPDLTGQTLISELLKKAGYRTGLVGKWHCANSRRPQPGFDRWFSYWINQYPHRGVQHFSDQGNQVVEEGQQSPLLTRRAIDFIREHHQDGRAASGQPFFLFVSYVDTHIPHDDAPDDLVAQYREASFRDIPREMFAACHGRTIEPVDTKPEVERKKKMEYYGAVSSIDREVGKVVAALEATGQINNTLIIYTGDHGLNCGQHGTWEKGNGTIPQNFLEESILIPCTLSWPAGGILQNATSDDLVSHPDLWATLLEIAGATPDAATLARLNSPGRSYLRQLRGDRVRGWRQTMISEYGNARMARKGRYKLIKRYPFAGITFPDELYDLHDDPRETRNLYGAAALRDQVQDLSAEIDQFFSQYSLPGRTGLDLEHLPDCNPRSPWLLAAKNRARRS